MKPFTIHPSGYRTYSNRFKAECVAKCLLENHSVSSVAVKHGMNPNVLHRWIKEHKYKGRHALSKLEQEEQVLSLDAMGSRQHNWLAVLPSQDQAVCVSKNNQQLKNSTAVNTAADNAVIHLEIRSDKIDLKLSWPGTDQSGLAKFIKELTV